MTRYREYTSCNKFIYFKEVFADLVFFLNYDFKLIKVNQERFGDRPRFEDGYKLDSQQVYSVCTQ